MQPAHSYRLSGTLLHGIGPGRERSLYALLSMGTALSRWKNLAELEDLILREVLAATAAERAALVYLEADSGEILQTRMRPQQPEARPMLVSRGIIKEALASGNTILHARDPKARVESESFLQSGAVAVLAAPLIVRGDVQALLYLESGPEHTFPDFDLELVSAIAGMSATPLETARRLEQLEQEKRAIEQGGGSAFQMIGESPAMQNVYRVIRRAAPSDTTVLILGESGTGKEMAARAIHSGSPRHRGPWVAINCACLGENLLESELFGHERGAFTGAFTAKPGKLEVANGGTLFLDEIGELPLSVQAKLLRVLQEREFERLGSTKVRRTDIRLIAATNQDLQQRIAEGRFRSDLFYRLNVVSLRVPPLRERAEDILLVASYFISRMQLKANRRVEGISSSARRALLHWNWPGNVCELQNVIERAIILGADCEIRLEDLPEGLALPRNSRHPPDTMPLCWPRRKRFCARHWPVQSAAWWELPKRSVSTPSICTGCCGILTQRQMTCCPVNDHSRKASKPGYLFRSAHRACGI